MVHNSTTFKQVNPTTMILHYTDRLQRDVDATDHSIATMPFNLSDIEDVRVIIKAKGNNYSIVPKEDKDEALGLRIASCLVLLDSHAIVTPSLEEIKESQPPKDQWIPVLSNILLPKGKNVLYPNASDSVIVTDGTTTKIGYFEGEWIDAISDDQFEDFLVAHWMPLPEPPQQ